MKGEGLLCKTGQYILYMLYLYVGEPVAVRLVAINYLYLELMV